MYYQRYLQACPRIGMGVVFDFLFVMMGILGTAAIPRSCPQGWVHYGHSCYKVDSPIKVFWIQAFETCHSLCAQLFVPNSLDEKQFIGKQVQAQEYFHDTKENGGKIWLGCTDTDKGVCNVSDDQQLQILGTADNHKCLTMSANSLELMEKDCSVLKFVTCERKQDSPKAVHCFAATDPDDDKALPNCLLDHAYMEIPILHPMQCCIACYKDPDCHSFNLSGKMCQLNNATISQVGDRFLIKSKNCAYFDLE